MHTNMTGSQLPCALSLAEALTVTHTGEYVFAQASGRQLYAFIQILEGTLQYRFWDGRPDMTIPAGRCVYIPKGCRYDCTYLPEQTSVMILQFDIHPDSLQQPPQEPILLSAKAQRLFLERSVPPFQMDPFSCAARIYDLLAMVRQDPPAVPKKYKRLLPAIEQMERTPTSDADVSYYAGLCGMSIPGFRRSFKEYLGYSPIDYRNSLRLNYAKKLIASGEYSVEEAAYQSGFTNLSFFYRLFRRKFQTTPRSL